MGYPRQCWRRLWGWGPLGRKKQNKAEKVWKHFDNGNPKLTAYNDGPPTGRKF